MKNHFLVFVFLMIITSMNSQSEEKIVDRDNDGIINRFDKCPDLWGLLKNEGCPGLVTSLLPMKTDIYKKVVFFDSEEIKLESQFKNTLDDLIIILKEFPTKSIEIDGHTDKKETIGNKFLSEKRAIAVLEYLMLKGISISRIYLNGYQDDYPLGNNKTKKGRTQNRRVEIRLYINDDVDAILLKTKAE